jgi:hypothetical protein
VAVGMMEHAEESNTRPLILCESKELFTFRDQRADRAGKLMENPKKVIYELFKKLQCRQKTRADVFSCVCVAVVVG